MFLGGLAYRSLRDVEVEDEGEVEVEAGDVAFPEERTGALAGGAGTGPETVLRRGPDPSCLRLRIRTL